MPSFFIQKIATLLGAATVVGLVAVLSLTTYLATQPQTQQYQTQAQLKKFDFTAFNWSDFKKQKEWRAFFNKPEWNRFSQSGAVGKVLVDPKFLALRNSPRLRFLSIIFLNSRAVSNFINSPSLKTLSQSQAARQVLRSPEFRRLADDFRRSGTVSLSAVSVFLDSPSLRNFIQSPDLANFLTSSELRTFVTSPDLANFLKNINESPEVINFLGVRPGRPIGNPNLQAVLSGSEFRDLVKSVFGQGAMEKPLRDFLLKRIPRSENKATYDLVPPALVQIDLSPILGDLLKQLLGSVLGVEISFPPLFSSEVVAKDGAGNPSVVRLWLAMDTPGSLIGGLNAGVYTYLIKGSEGVAVWEHGPTYPMGSVLTSMLDGVSLTDLLGLLTGSNPNFLADLMKNIGKRCQNPATLPPPIGNAEKTIETVKQYFPGQKIMEIAAGHWHIDHSEDMPRLQKLAEAEFGFRPLLRIHEKDRVYPDADGSPGGADQVFRDACFQPGSWSWGEDLNDNSPLTGTSFRAVYLGCHTFGMTDIVSDQEKMGIHDFFPPGMLEVIGIGGQVSDSSWRGFQGGRSFGRQREGRLTQGEGGALGAILRGFLFTQNGNAASWLGNLGNVGLAGLLDPLTEALGAVMTEDKAGCESGVGQKKYYEAAPAKGYPSYYVHFPEIVPAGEFPPLASTPTPTLTPTSTVTPRPGTGTIRGTVQILNPGGYILENAFVGVDRIPKRNPSGRDGTSDLGEGWGKQQRATFEVRNWYDGTKVDCQNEGRVIIMVGTDYYDNDGNYHFAKVSPDTDSIEIAACEPQTFTITIPAEGGTPAITPRVIEAGAPNADLDGSGTVDGQDASFMFSAWGSLSGETNFNSAADLNSDDKVNALDASILMSQFGR